MPNMPYGFILLMWSSQSRTEASVLQPGGGVSGYTRSETGCHYKHVRTVELKPWYQRATIGGLVAPLRVIWILMRAVLFFFPSNGAAAAVLAFVLWCVYPALPLPIKGLSIQLWFISWIKLRRNILLTDNIKINSCELWWTLSVHVLTH